MKRLMRILIVSMLLVAIPVTAGPLMKNQVSRTANWVVHVNNEQFNDTWLGQLIRSELEKQGVEEKLQDFASIFSFHPIDDVRDVTIYGNGPDREQAIVLIDGNFNEETLLAMVRMNPEHEEIPHGDVILHRWLHEEKKGEETKSQMMYGCLYNGKIVVMGAGLEAVKRAVDVLNGSTPNAASGVFNQASLNASGAFFQVAANAVGQIAEHQQQAAILKQVDELGLAIGETGGKVYMDLSLRVTSEETAQNITKVLEGIIAYVTLASYEQPNLAELAKKLQISCADSTVRVHFESDSTVVFESLKEQWEKKKKQNNPQQP